MNIKVNSKWLGELNVFIAPDFKDCEIEGYGKARISYASFGIDSVIINGLDVNPYSDCAKNLAKKLIEVGCPNIVIDTKEIEWGKASGSSKTGIKHHATHDSEFGEKYEKNDFLISSFSFKIEDEYKQKIKAAYFAEKRDVEKDLKEGKVKVTVCLVGCDFVHESLSFEGLDFNTHYGIEQKYGMRDLNGNNRLDFIPKDFLIEGTDVTKFVAEKMNNFQTKEQKLEKHIDEAVKTGQPVLISKYVTHESDTPLRNDGEDDMVDVLTYAMPNGKIETKYVHNY